MVDAAAVVTGCARTVDAGRRTPNRDSGPATDRFSGWRTGATGCVQPGARAAASTIQPRTPARFRLVPELPEVERARALVEARALGRRIAAVDDADRWVCRPHGPGEIADAITGRTFTKALRRGKSMWLETDGGDGPDL